MRAVAVHHPDTSDRVDICFWVDDAGHLQSYQPDVTPGSLLATMTMMRKRPDVKWVPWFEELEARAPNVDYWEVFLVKDDLSPKEFFTTLRKMSVRG